MKLPWHRRPTAPATIPTEPGFTVMAKGTEFVIRTISYGHAAGELTIELLRRDEWDRRYRIR